MQILIESFSLSHLHQEEDLGFHGLAYLRIEKIVDEIIAPHIVKYRTAIDKFDSAIKQDIASTITGEISDLDYQAGLTYHSLREIINHMRRYNNATKAEAARKIDIVMRKFDAKKDPTSLALVEQMETLQNMIDELKNPAIFPLFSTIGAKSWLEDLDACNSRMQQLYSQRTSETSAYVSGLSKQCRIDVDKEYLAIVEYVNTMIRINDTDKYEPVVVELNRLIDEMKIVLAERKTSNENRRHHNLKLASASDIPVQKYTGKPIYPAFQVFMDGIELVIGVDYTVAYSDNTNPGTATISVNGKGAFSGKKMITFNIEHAL